MTIFQVVVIIAINRHAIIAPGNYFTLLSCLYHLKAWEKAIINAVKKEKQVPGQGENVDEETQGFCAARNAFPEPIVLK